QGFALFGAAAEYKRITAFEPHDREPAPGPLDQQRVDLALRQSRSTTVRALPHEHSLCSGRRFGQQRWRDEAIVHDHVGRSQDLESLRGDQTGVARPGADKIIVSSGTVREWKSDSVLLMWWRLNGT